MGNHLLRFALQAALTVGAGLFLSGRWAGAQEEIQLQVPVVILAPQGAELERVELVLLDDGRERLLYLEPVVRLIDKEAMGQNMVLAIGSSGDRVEVDLVGLAHRIRQAIGVMLAEKLGENYKLPPLGQSLEPKQVANWSDLISQFRDQLKGRSPSDTALFTLRLPKGKGREIYIGPFILSSPPTRWESAPPPRDGWWLVTLTVQPLVKPAQGKVNFLNQEVSGARLGTQVMLPLPLMKNARLMAGAFTFPTGVPTLAFSDVTEMEVFPPPSRIRLIRTLIFVGEGILLVVFLILLYLGWKRLTERPLDLKKIEEELEGPKIELKKIRRRPPRMRKEPPPPPPDAQGGEEE